MSIKNRTGWVVFRKPKLGPGDWQPCYFGYSTIETDTSKPNMFLFRREAQEAVRRGVGRNKYSYYKYRIKKVTWEA